MNNNIRGGNFTSSEIWKLTKKNKAKTDFGEVALTYIKEKNMERLLGKQLSRSSGKECIWGNHLERIAFDRIPSIGYTLTSNKTLSHPTIPYWKGSPDGSFTDFISGIETTGPHDIKCPYTLKSFCELVMEYTKNGDGEKAIEEIKKTESGYKYFCQLVSNAIITGASFAELIVYMPYEDELAFIKEEADGDPDKYWIWSSVDEELPSIHRGGYFQDLNIIRFEVKREYKDELTAVVLKAGSMLIERPSVLIASRDEETNTTLIQSA